MKIAILPSISDTVNHILHCINIELVKKGHDVFFPQITVEDNQKKLATSDFLEIINNKPDFVIFVGMAGIIRHESLDQYDHLLEANNIPYVMLFYDFPINLPTLAKTKLDYLKHIFTWDRAHIEYFKHYGISNVSYLPLATSPEYFNKRTKQEKEHEISFVGGLTSNKEIQELYSRINRDLQSTADGIVNTIIKSNNTEAFFNEATSNEEYHDFYLYVDHRYNNYVRKKIISKLASRYETHIFGNQEWNSIKKIHYHAPINYTNIVRDVYSKSKININISTAHLTTSLNQRIFDCYGSGNFMISDYREDIDNLFKDHGFQIPIYKTINELQTLVDNYLSYPKEQENLANTIQHHVITNHTWEKRVEELLNYLK